jgi:hypothetical protein
MWLYMYATVFVRLSTQGFKKKLKTGALIEISKIQTFYLSETVSNTELPLKLCFRLKKTYFKYRIHPIKHLCSYKRPYLIYQQNMNKRPLRSS